MASEPSAAPRIPVHDRPRIVGELRQIKRGADHVPDIFGLRPGGRARPPANVGAARHVQAV
jgi:hypothetical protein